MQTSREADRGVLAWCLLPWESELSEGLLLMVAAEEPKDHP